MYILVAYLAWIGGTLASPTHSHSSRGQLTTCTSDRIPVRRDAEHLEIAQRRASRHEEQMQAYRRNILDDVKVATHDEVQMAARGMEQEARKRKKRAPSDAHTQPMADYFNGGVDILYTLPTFVGTPAQGVNLVPDTGSADMWIPWVGSNMAEGHETFAPNSSSTFKQSNRTFTAQYGKGKAEGVVGYDNVEMGGFTVRNQVLGIAIRVDEQFQRQPNDGIMGFCSSILSKYPARTFFENLILGNAPALREPYFSVFLSRGRDIQPNVPGILDGSEMCLGCMATPVNATARGSMLMVPVTTFAFFQVLQDGISLNGQAIPGTSCQAMMDTGTTDLYLPVPVADAMMAPLNGRRTEDGSYVVPRSSVTPSTKIALGYGGQKFEINWLDLVNGFVDNTRTSFLLNVVGEDITDPNGDPLAIIGDTFLKNVISVYQYSYNGAPAIGLQQIVSTASASNDTATTSGPIAQSSANNPAPTGKLGTSSVIGSSLTASGAGATTTRSAGAPASAAPASSSGAAAAVMRARHLRAGSCLVGCLLAVWLVL